ncbi:MAG: DUF2442 domain-containing protein [Gemmatimonadaceae bacterium]
MKTKSAQPGRRTSAVEVVNVSPHGFWLLIGGLERFVPFKEFPWFREATIGELTNVTLPSPHHLYWPDLDIDLAVDSLDHPARYPLVSIAVPANKPLKSATSVTEKERKAAHQSPRKRRRG